jgi:hypothetical protein
MRINQDTVLLWIIALGLVALLLRGLYLALV